MNLKDSETSTKNLSWLALAGAAALAAAYVLYRKRNALPSLIDDLVSLAETSIHKLEDQYGESLSTAS